MNYHLNQFETIIINKFFFLQWSAGSANPNGSWSTKDSPKVPSESARPGEVRQLTLSFQFRSGTVWTSVSDFKMDSTTKLPTRLMVITDQPACECRCLFSPSLVCLSLRLALDGLLSLGLSLKHTFKSVWFLVLVPANPTLTTIPMLM